MSEFPTSVDEITPAWLAEATGLPVEAADIEQIGAGIGVMSALYRVRLTGAGCPETVVVKLPGLAEESVFTSTILRMYLREAAFFAELADQAPVRVPACHHSTIDPETSEFVLVMEDLGGAPRGRPGEGHGDRRRRAGRRRPGRLARHLVGPGPRAGRARRHREPRRPDLQGGAPDGVRRGMGEARQGAHHPRRHPSRSAPGWTDAMPGLVDDLATEPTTMCHGDWRADNLLFEPDGSVAALDFQLIGTARGTYDLAYFITQSLDRADASQHEKALFDRWIRAVEAAGRRPRTTPPPGTTTARPPSSASSTPWWPGGAWTPATPARSTSPPRCSTASTEPSPSSTSPPCS